MAFTNADLALLKDAVTRNVVSGAVETPLDATAIIPELAAVAVNEGFSPTTGAFFNAIRNRPFSTLISFLAFAGGSGIPLTVGKPLA
jgi:hypothetical protein